MHMYMHMKYNFSNANGLEDVPHQLHFLTILCDLGLENVSMKYKIVSFIFHIILHSASYVFYVSNSQCKLYCGPFSLCV